MIRKLIGSAEVVNGQAQYTWEIGEGTVPGKRKIYVSYIESDGYMAGEAYEDAFIRIPTSITMGSLSEIVSGTTDPENPETITLQAIVNQTSNLNPVDDGKVQFQVKTANDETFVNLGTPVQVNDGVAEYTYEIPEVFETTIEIKAIYLANLLYGGCETIDVETLSVRGRVTLSVEDIRTNRGNTENIVVYIQNASGGELDTGKMEIYIDEVMIAQTNVGANGRIDLPHTFNEGNGEHVLLVKYKQNDKFDENVVTTQCYIRLEVVLANPSLYADQTIIGEGGVVESQGIATIPIIATTTDGDAVPEGLVDVTVNGTDMGNVAIDIDGKGSIQYNIPDSCVGGTELQYSLSYQENPNYQAVTVQGTITVRFRQSITFETVTAYVDGEPTDVAFDGNIGDMVNISARLVDENGNPVSEGEVEFSLEQSESGEPDGEINGGQNQNDAGHQEDEFED